MKRIFLFALATIFAAAPALADSVTGTVLAFDRKANLIILGDKTVFTLANGDAEVPEGLKSGDVVKIVYDSLGEDGYGVITSITITQ